MSVPEDPRPFRELRIDPMELEDAFGHASWERPCFLDVETGEVLMISGETHGILESAYEELGDAEITPQALAEVLERRGVPEWQREEVLRADRVETGLGTRIVRVPEADSSEAYRDMEDFIETVRDRRLQNRLWRAIDGRRPFRRFKDVLLDHPHERERWFEFKRSRVRGRMLDWLEDEGIRPIGWDESPKGAQ